MGCYNSTYVNAPISQVWQAMRNFHDLSWAPNVVEHVDVVGDAKPDQIGAKRVLNGAFHETLVAFDETNNSFSYRIDNGPGAVSKENVSGYIGTVKLFSVTDSNATFVLWTSSWEIGGEDVKAFCDPIYVALLTDLKASFS
ncbi:hypothetical protein tinsulaeT_03270 [Thalassotalea insulae]|uniref:Polyketide cyclase/dehydrase/lipid transport protein n=1 Tax=Thalassotalea insulae TaxID=2056778 RepID=A0ABQ6GNR5_9GAMM|nr:SRPBCC family protein [Thalassotalea insulae]GLX76987.1 hypothetical protein tinsulaeT_03270 [Thalassotalea insulae]